MISRVRNKHESCYMLHHRHSIFFVITTFLKLIWTGGTGGTCPCTLFGKYIWTRKPQALWFLGKDWTYFLLVDLPPLRWCDYKVSGVWPYSWPNMSIWPLTSSKIERFPVFDLCWSHMTLDILQNRVHPLNIANTHAKYDTKPTWNLRENSVASKVSHTRQSWSHRFLRLKPRNKKGTLLKLKSHPAVSLFSTICTIKTKISSLRTWTR